MAHYFSTAAHRIGIAVALSVVVHSLIMWLPEVHLPESKKPLPPLIAKLEAIPKPVAKIQTAKPNIQPQPQEKPIVAAQPTPIIEPLSPLPESAPQATSAPVIDDISIAENTPVIASSTEPVSAPVVAEIAPPKIAEPPVIAEEKIVSIEEPQRPPLPKRASLHYDIYQGEKNFKIGESIHTLTIQDGRYTLQSEVQTTGLAKLLKSYRMNQTSSGAATENTLKPYSYKEEITESSGQKTLSAEFDWENSSVHYSRGNTEKLPPQAQDILSILYQFPALHEQMESIEIYISTGKKFEKYTFEIAFAEPLSTAMGMLQTVHFRKRRATNEEGIEIWFAQQYRLLPVKLRHLDRDGKISAEAIITDIRVSDE